jgi:long-chain acyl-CoA synthetase
MTATAEDVWRSFAATADAAPDRVALRDAGTEVGFGELRRRAVGASAALAELGVGTGQVLAVAGAGATSFVTLLLAALRVGAPALLLASAQRAAVLAAVLRDVGVAWLVTDDRALAERAATTAGRDAVAVGAFAGVRGAATARPDESIATVKLSSGSTGEPKAIAVSAAAVLAEADAVAATFGLGPGRAVLCPVPLHHSYGFDLGVLPMLRHGATLAVHAPLVPSRLLQQLQAPDVRAVLGVPAVYGALLETPLDVPPDLSGAGLLVSCTAPLSPSAIEAFDRRFHAPLCQHYGSSEAGGVTTHVPGEVHRRPESVGRPMPGVELEIVDGEVTVAGPAVARGYLWGEPEPSPFRGGRLHMGDGGFLDDDGFLTVTGRLDALINVGGLKVSPAEVERVLERHPAVREAAVSGRSDGRGGELVQAAVAVTGDVTELELVAHCREALEDFKVPRRIELRDSLPRLPAGKVDRRA